MVYFQRARAELAIAKGDYDEAASYLDDARKLDPDNQALDEQLWRAWQLQYTASPEYARMREQQRRARERKMRLPVSRDATLAECLARLTKDSLIATARNTPLRRAEQMHKTDLALAVAAQLTEPAVLWPSVSGLFDTERQALRDVLEAGGVLPWETFDARYGNDLDESQSWNWRPPETTMGRLRMLGLLSATAHRSAGRRALGLGLMLQAALLLMVAVSRQLGQADGQVVALLGLGLLPLAVLAARAGWSAPSSCAQAAAVDPEQPESR